MKKNNEFKFKELVSTPRGKAIVFFAGYLIFFIVIAVVARVGGTNNTTKKYEAGSALQYSLSSIESNNYKFTYTLEMDGNSSNCSGERYVTREMISCTNGNYYGDNENYFINNNGVWVRSDSPYLYGDFYEVSNVKSLIERATYISKTEYDSGKDVYEFSLSTATITKYFENIDMDVEEVLNTLLLSTDEDGNVNEIKFKLNSYCINKGICNSSMTIDLQYESFGEIEEIISPLNN